MKKYHYYRFWIATSGQSYSSTIRYYTVKPDKDVLYSDLENWEKNLPFCGVAEGWREGYDEIKKVPKNRTDCLKQFKKICDQRNKINKKHKLLQDLLCCKPFNGEK